MPILKRLAPPSLAIALFAATAAIGAEPPAATITTIDLSKPFATRSAWRFTATQEPEIDDPVGMGGDKAPGEIHLCLRKAASAPCDGQVQEALRPPSQDDVFSSPHYLNTAKVVHDAAGRPLLILQTASVNSGDSDQLVLTQALAYRPRVDQFVRVFSQGTGRNNNQEIRFIETGRLKGDIVSAEPTDNAPFGFWITVNAPASPSAYKQVLRYRSATHYGDGNPLAVIDSEMPNIQQHLGLSRPGSPLPLPTGPCPKPHLVRGALWCR